MSGRWPSCISSAVFVVFKKAASGLGPEKTGAYQTLEEWTRPEARLSAFVVQVFHPIEHSVEPGSVCPFERPDTEFEAHLHRQVDLGGLGHVALLGVKDLIVVRTEDAVLVARRGRGEDVREIGRRLNVDTVLEGSVRKAGKRLRITVQLIDVADGFHLWSEKYDRDLEDIFAIQDEVTRAIVSKLTPTLLGAPDTPVVTPNRGWASTVTVKAVPYLAVFSAACKGMFNSSHRWRVMGMQSTPRPSVPRSSTRRSPASNNGRLSWPS